MGNIVSYKHGENSVDNVDPRLWDIVQQSIAAMPYDAEIRSGAERVGGKGNHNKGYAVDVTFLDGNGNKIPDTGKTGGATSAAIYEQWAKTARQIQQQQYPALDDTFRWGGGFQQGYPFDFMHLDITPARGGAMAYYDWDTGWNQNAYAALPGLREVSGKPIPPLGLNNEAMPVTASRGIDQKRMQFQAALDNTPLPRPRPDTPVQPTLQPGMMGRGQPSTAGAPVPSTMSPALAAARQRLTVARETRAADLAKNGDTSAAAMSVTPRLPQGFDPANPQTFVTDPQEQKRIAATAVPMDQSAVQARATILDEGVGSLLNGGINPAAPNPAVKPPVAGLRLPVAPAAQPAPTAQPAKTETPTPTAVPRTPQTAQLANGKTVQVGQSYIVGDRLMIADVGADGKAVLRDVKDVRDDFLRKNVDPNAPLLFEDSIAGNVARGVAGPMIKQGVENAANDAKKAIGNTLNTAVSTVGDAAKGLFDKAQGMFQPANSNAKPGNTLSAPGAGLTPQQKAAMTSVPLSAGVKPLTTPKPANTLTTIANPDYAAWEKKYGDGSQLQTAPTGGIVTANQLAAISGSGAPVPLPRPAALPPAPPKTIQVSRPAAGNALPATTTVAPKPSAPSVYQSGGYLYSPNGNGGYTKVGKVGSSAPLSKPSSSGSSQPSDSWFKSVTTA